MRNSCVCQVREYNATKGREIVKLPEEERKRRAALLFDLRDKSGLTQGTVAARLSPLDASFMRRYQDWEKGRSWETLAEAGLALLFGVEIDYFSRGYIPDQKNELPQKPMSSKKREGNRSSSTIQAA